MCYAFCAGHCGCGWSCAVLGNHFSARALQDLAVLWENCFHMWRISPWIWSLAPFLIQESLTILCSAAGNHDVIAHADYGSYYEYWRHVMAVSTDPTLSLIFAGDNCCYSWRLPYRSKRDTLFQAMQEKLDGLNLIMKGWRVSVLSVLKPMNMKKRFHDANLIYQYSYLWMRLLLWWCFGDDAGNELYYHWYYSFGGIRIDLGFMKVGDNGFISMECILWCPCCPDSCSLLWFPASVVKQTD